MSAQNDRPGQSPMILMSRKGPNRFRENAQPQLTIKTPEQNASGPSSANSGFNEPKRPLTASVVFINDAMEIANFIINHLFDDNQNFTVIGTIGVQGTGKSTFLSMLAGNQPLDKYRQYIFRPCSKDTIYSGLYQTNGLHVYVTDSRVIYIDCKPFNCSAVFEEQVRKSKSDAPNLSTYKNTQVEGLTLLGLMFELCDTILFNIDWFIDMNSVQEVLRAALYSEFNFRKYSGYPRSTNLVVIHQRAKASDFEMFMVKKRARMIKSMFKDSGYDVNGGLSMANLGFTEYSECEPDVNYIVLDDLPQWSKEPITENKLLTISYDTMLKRLRPALIGLKKHDFRVLDKLKPLRRRGRREKLLLPPTLDGKKAAQLKSEDQNAAKNENNGIAEEEKALFDFNPDHMPNITKYKASQIPTEPWNEKLDAGLSALSPPQSNDEALKSLNLLLATHSRRSDYVDDLLPLVEQRMTERQWLGYAHKVFDVTKRAYATKYFISNNGRLAPRLVRKLRDTTKILYTDSKSSNDAALRRSAKRRTAKNAENSTKLIDTFNELNIEDKRSKSESVHEESIEKEEERDSFNAYDPNKGTECNKSSGEESISEFDETTSDEDSDSMQSSDNSSDEREKNVVVARRNRRRRISDED